MSAVFESVAPATNSEERITFSATGSEYFRIWIVNLLLSIVTLGIYSAWAKVKRNQYFYGSTQLAGSSFEYHGNPVAILKGRIAALVLFGGYQLAFQYSLAAGIVMLVVFLAAMPWMIWKSLQFGLYNSSYRGIRFGFGGSLKDAYFHYLLLPVVSVFALGLMYPFLHHRIKRFQHTESRYGRTPFSFDATVGAFYKAYFGMFLLLVLGGGLITVAAIVLGKMLQPTMGHMSAAIGKGAGLTLVYVYLFCLMYAFMAMIQNLIWNHTQLGPHRFRSTMKGPRLAWLYVSNTLGIILTLGLFIPFAHVRALKYRLESTALIVSGSLDDVVAGSQGDVGAVGDGMADLAGFDLAL
ncbi:YjgN family protein [Pseudoduganella buxea]|uniref:DUF898 family protein n=1 Tax=Pseudoduganella buxea TaxID=1949069 RepID=A0A6I3SVW9_9BURK|nr:YjgN family protein [Pseudoduganella buxea]MTV51897.1 DUF898 family protein [Pseudoduganella buxea]GGB98375.1 membrane protein [Pseudoduganella buxea]